LRGLDNRAEREAGKLVNMFSTYQRMMVKLNGSV
jgi:hypothetical protein